MGSGLSRYIRTSAHIGGQVLTSEGQTCSLGRTFTSTGSQARHADYEWIVGKAGDYIHVPSGARHAWRNVSSEPLVALIITTTRLGRFFQEVGRPVTPADLAHFATVAAEYGYWNATPEENAAVGIHFSF
jgi:uncharacterized RmlC-like cupin family protein